MLSRIFFLVFFFSFFYIHNITAQRFNAGFVVGAIASQVSGDKASGFNKPGFEIGGLVSTKLSEKFDGSFQIVFIQKGSRARGNVEQGDYTFYRMRLNYVQVPLLFQYHYSKKFRFEAGTGIAVLLSSSEENEFGKIPESYNRKEFNKLEWTMMASMNYLLGENLLMVLGVENSVLPIRKYDGTELFRLDRDQFNSLLRFSFRYTFKTASTE